jgi:peroxiredoxin
MRNIFRIFLLVLTLLFISISSIHDINAQFFSPFEIEGLIGKKAPVFTAIDLSGKDVPFSSFRGKPILLNFWATWCPYCREERPQLNSIYETYKDKGLVIVAVSVDRSSAIVKRYINKIPADFVILHDNNKEAAGAYGIYSLPTSFLIDREGVIKHKFIGPNWTDLKKKFIEKLVQ